nr:MAG TPA: hypothetical protein [Caudoviricetes sp.]
MKESFKNKTKMSYRDEHSHKVQVVDHIQVYFYV